MSRRVAILGAGISGLAAAWRLRQLGAEPVVFDPAGPGGVIRSVVQDGYLCELGPNTVLEKGPALTALIDGLGLRSRVVSPRSAAKRRYVLFRGRPVALPTSPLSLLFSPLLSGAAKAQLLAEPFRAPGTAGDESVAAFFSRRLGVEVVERMVDPFVSGIYAGDPCRLSARHCFPRLWEWERGAGSLLKGALASRRSAQGPRVRMKMISFEGGLSVLPRTLADAFGGPLRTQRVERLDRSGPRWLVRGEGAFDAVLSTLPAAALAGLLEASFPETEPGFLRRLPCADVRVWHFGVDRARVAHPLDGFGVLAPSSEGSDILGVLFSSAIFAGRAPEGKVLLTVFQGGVRQPRWCADGADAEARAAAWAATAQWLGITGGPEMVRSTLWRPAIPQYEVGHQTFLDRVEGIERSLPGWHVGGTLRWGVAVGDCVAAAFAAAEKIRGLL